MALPVVSYHNQETSEFCGAACLKMAIEALNRTAGSQTALFHAAHGFNTVDPKPGWSSPPDGVGHVLETKGQLTSNMAAVLDERGEAAITRQAIWSLHQHGVPPIVLVWGMSHWVVLVDFETDGVPQSLDDDSYRIKAVMLHDPSLEDGEDPPPPPRFVTYSKWTRDYLMPVPKGHWEGKRVAVGAFVP